MFGSNCCFLSHIQVSKEAGEVVWYSHLFKNFPQFVVIYTVKGFGIVNKAEVVGFLELSCSFDDPTDVDNLIPVPALEICILLSRSILGGSPQAGVRSSALSPLWP